ncbi:MAG: short-chain dehydrogenase/reductase [Pseudonocardiales bacterium]|nr:short-chain dehydrogenase/reductase [Pseudonocardiales bacterium]
MPNRLDGKVVVITGAAKGIGRGIARRFATEGASLVIIDRDKELGAATTAALVEDFGVEALFLQANMGYEDQACGVIEEAGNKLGRLDVLINNAQGFNGLGPLIEKTTGEFDYSLRTGFYASFWTLRTAVPFMREVGGGSIINFVSLDGISGEPYFADYNVAKEAIGALTKVAARELGPLQIRVNNIAPVADTPTMARSESQWPGFGDNILKALPLGRLGDPEADIGGVALFLATEDSRFVTGMTMFADGGLFLSPPRMIAEPDRQNARPERRLVWTTDKS